MNEAWKTNVLQQTTVIDNPHECHQIVEEIMNPKNPPPDGKIVIFFDCEGVNLGRNGYATLLQIATMNGKAYLFDIKTSPNLFQNGGLKKLLENESIIKVIHDCRNDSYNLYHQFGISLKNIFDTRAAFTILESQKIGQAVNELKNIGLDVLCRLNGVPCNVSKQKMKNIYRSNQNYWSRRPLTQDMIIYASSDVLNLPQLYNIMSNKIKPKMSTLFADLCYEQVNVYLKPDDVKKRLNHRKQENKMSALEKRMKTMNEKKYRSEQK